MAGAMAAALPVGASESWQQRADRANRDRAEGRWDEAERLYRSALAEARVEEPEHPRIAELLNNLGAQYQILGRYSQAEDLLVQALDAWERHPALVEDRARTKANLAGIYRATGRYADAEKIYLDLLEHAGSRFGKDSENYAALLAELAELYRRQGRLDQAQRAAEHALAKTERATEILAPILRSRGQVADALALFQRAHAWQMSHLQPNSPRLATTWNAMAEIHCSRREFALAEGAARRAVAVWEQAYGPEHPNLAVGLNNLAQAIRLQGRFAEAEPLYRRSLAILENHPALRVELAKCQGNFADFQHAQGKEADATRYYLQAVKTMQAAVGEGHPEVALLLAGMAAVRRSQMNYRESADLYRRSIPILEQSFGPENPRVRESIEAYRSMMREAGRHMVFAR